MIVKRQAALEQMKAGFNTFSFLEKTTHITETDKVLLDTNAEKVTSEYLKRTLTKSLEKLPARNEEEERAKKFMKSCMNAMNGN